MVDVWATIKVERGALAEDLAGIGPDQWETPSLCDGWTVRDALAHMTASAKLNVPGFLKDFVAAGFNIPKMDERQRAAVIGATPVDTLANFRAQIGSTRHPPGPANSWLGEAIVHAEDIRRPLGIEHDYPMEAIVQVADFYKGSNLILGSKKRIAGLMLRATDTEWSHGDGPLVEGPMLSLMLALTGRRVALDDLTGDGLETLRSRG